MTIHFLPDRYPKGALTEKYPDVAKSLQRSAATMMENSQELVAWVGVARATREETVVFLPHGAPDQEEVKEVFARNLMRSIARFAREHSRTGEERGQDSATQAALLADLATDYREHGLYSTRERVRSRQDGKPDWARTVKSDIGYPTDDGIPIYTNISTTRFSSFATNIIAKIQAEVINEIREVHGWWLAEYFGSRERPRNLQPVDWPRKSWPNLLRMARRELFQSRAIRLVTMLLEYLEGKMETGAGPVFCGISDFSTMWEVMLRDTLAGVEPHWNSYLPGPFYLSDHGGGVAAGRMQLDIVVRDNEKIFILDAKYYRADSGGYVPGVSDVSKQIMYQRAVESTGKVAAHNITNAFLFPAGETGRSPYKAVRFYLPDETAAAGFPEVACQYVSVADVIAAYATRRKMADQSWLNALSQSGVAEFHQAAS